MKNINKRELIEFISTDNKSGYKTKEKFITKKFDGLLELINDHNNKYFNLEIPFTQKLYNFLYDITEIPKCDNCGCDIQWRGIFTEGYLKNCSKKCRNESKLRIKRMKQTNLEKYGVESVLNVIKFKEKRNTTNINKFGVLNIFENDLIKEKMKITSQIKYGTDFPIQSDVIKNKRIENNLLKYGVEYPSKLQSNKDKEIKKYRINFENKMLLKNYKVLNYFDDDVIEILHPDGHIFKSFRNICNNRFNHNAELSTVLLPIGGSKSTYELEVQNFLSKLDIVFELCNRKILNGLEIDIYLPEYKLGIEFNGLYWHSNLFKDNNYHLNKTELCKQQDIQLLHVFEDEWINKKEIVKSIIKSKLGLIENKIYARKCYLKEIDSVTSSKFLDINHVQGNVNSKIKIGLFHENELVSIMTFGKKRISLGSKVSCKNDYEMYRFCNKLNTTVIGGASKLLSYFIKKYKPKSILSFADRRYSHGELYRQLGFAYINNTKPNYWYFNKNELIRYHRFKFRKSVLVKEGFDENKTENEIMGEREYLKIYDSGNLKYLLTINGQ